MKITGIPCDECGVLHVEFSADSEVWNAVVRAGGEEHQREYICLVCFANQMEAWIKGRLSERLDDQADREVRTNGIPGPALVCNQKGCNKIAQHRFTWPGENEAGICAMHVGALYATVGAMGMHLQITPIDPAVV